MVAKLSSEQIRGLVDSRDRAYAELRRNASAYDSGGLFQALFKRDTNIAICKITKITRREPGGADVTLTISLERNLRGEVPHEYIEETNLSPNPLSWIKGPPPQWVRIIPVEGKRIVVASSELQGKRTNTAVLDLDDAGGSTKLAGAERFLKADATSAAPGTSLLLQALADPAPLARDLAVRRLLQMNSCTTDAVCGKDIVAAAERLLASNEANDRREAVNWLREMGDEVQAAEPGNAKQSGLALEPIRAQLAKTVGDRNVAVGDEAFMALEQLNFHVRENVGYCIEIVPAIRASERYPISDKGRVIGGPLNGGSLCLYHWRTPKN
ncbi:MAG TPA: hypothetical protein VKH63_07505 [Candidatus Acidoferrum sp.]|nr:hypothetical protein [Candidatus Acidoferrum sp.]